MYAVTRESAQAAREAENRTNFVNEKGKYVGQFTKAERIVASTGTEGIGFSFKGHDGVLSNFSLYTRKKDGELLRDYGIVVSIMTVLGIREIQPKRSKIQEYDKEAGGVVERDGEQFVELLNKDIGCLFIMEEYERDGGGTGWGARLNAVFRASDELVASEILDRKTRPEKLPYLIESLRDRPLKKRTNGHARPAGSRGAEDDYYGGHAGAPDDIPF
ncbi:hypothetical protein WI36_24050 [Burkholderia ubonensis]|uniref:hypothetical protein n=1 Tax=Burkholderia ubonensis TaxID=101571 RepID=UPI00075E00DD|nr:hypothetical protein [Burkholderia ubonensis]KUZ66844.1 hypothetical protein WI36_24050 [Burkholderia ubonensis]